MADKRHADACKMLASSGYKVGGAVHSDAVADARMIKRAIHQHDVQQHAGKHTDVKLSYGGKVQKRAVGGGIKKPGTTVNVIVATGGAKRGPDDATRESMQGGMRAPPMGAPPPGGMAPPPMMPPGGLPPGIGAGPPMGASPLPPRPPIPGAGPAPGVPAGFRRGGTVRPAGQPRKRGGKAC